MPKPLKIGLSNGLPTLKILTNPETKVILGLPGNLGYLFSSLAFLRLLYKSVQATKGPVFHCIGLVHTKWPENFIGLASSESSSIRPFRNN
jgi:hypothetical protein